MTLQGFLLTASAVLDLAKQQIQSLRANRAGRDELMAGVYRHPLVHQAEQGRGITIEPTTLAGGKEPIRTLARHRRWDRKTWFGTRLVPMGTGTIFVGDTVEPENPHG